MQEQDNVNLDVLSAPLPSLDNKVNDDKDRLETSVAENQHLSIELENHKQALKDKEADRDLRRGYANRIMWYLIWYSTLIGLLVVFVGATDNNFTLPESVLVTLCGSTAAAAIGLVGFVAKGLFPQSK